MFFFKKKTPPVEAGSQTAPAAAASQSTSQPGAGSDTIFGLKKAENTDTDALDALLNGTENTKPKEQKSVLGAAPRSFLRKPDTQRHDFAQFKKKFFQFTVIVAVFTAGYFQVQLNPGLNIWPGSSIHAFTAEKDALIYTQTEINFINILRSTFVLNAFTTAAANYDSAMAQSVSVAATSSQKALALQTATEDKTTITQSLSTLKMLLPSQLAPKDSITGKTLIMEEDFKNALLNRLNTELGQASSPRDIQRLSTAIALLNNTRLRTTLADLTIDEITDDQIGEIAGIANNLNKNNFAMIAAVKKQRMAWSAIIHDIEEITKTIDPLYNTYYQGKNVSSIIYESFRFNTDTGEISLDGTTRTDTSKNFTVIANLIDALEAASQFKDVAMSQFSKAEDEQIGFIANLSISLFLENDTSPESSTTN